MGYKISALTALTAATADDLLVIVDAPGGSAATKKITVANFLANLPATTFANAQTFADAIATVADLIEAAADPAAPSAGNRRLFARDGNYIAEKDDAGNVHALAWTGGNVAALALPAAIAATKAGTFSDADTDADGTLAVDKTNSRVYFRAGGAWYWLPRSTIVALLDGSQAFTGQQTFDAGIKADTVAEKTSTAGVTIDSLLVKDGMVDLNGLADALILDADGDTTISAPTEDQIDIEINNADDFTFTANTFTALNGSSIATDTIAETTTAAGVTIDGALLKDGGATLTEPLIAQEETAAAANPASGYRKLYPHNAGNWLDRDDAGYEHALAWAVGQVAHLATRLTPGMWQHKNAATGSVYGPLRIECGRDTLSGGGTCAVTFQTAFTSILEIFVQDKTAAAAIYAASPATTGFTATGTASDTFCWLAIGID